MTTYDVDAVAGGLAQLGAIGRQSPPSWDVGRDMIPVVGTDGSPLGKVLPGRGLMLNASLKSLGITRPIPHVFEQSRIERLVDRIGRHRIFRDGDLEMAAVALACALQQGKAGLLLPLGMGAIVDWVGVLRARGAGGQNAEDGCGTKNSFTTVAAVWHTTGRAGGQPGAYVPVNIPGGEAPTNATLGSLFAYLQNPTGGNQKYLLTWGWNSSQQINMALLVDILVSAGNVTTNVVTTAQTVNTTALTRYTNGIGVQITFEITTALGATPANVTVAYTNSGGTGSRSTGAIALTASGIVQRLQPSLQTPFILLQSGDVGVASIQTVTVSALMGAGVMMVQMFKPLMYVPGIASNIHVEKTSTSQIEGVLNLAQTSGAALGHYHLFIWPNGTSSGQIVYFTKHAEG